MKLYLAHPLELRKEIREIELRIEANTGIELLNPFYDTGRDDIHDIDAGKKDRDAADLDFTKIVTKDLANLNSCEDGMVAYIKKGTYSIGTICECWHSLEDSFAPIYIVSPDSLAHPWVRHMIYQSGGVGFPTWEAFEQFLKEITGNAN